LTSFQFEPRYLASYGVFKKRPLLRVFCKRFLTVAILLLAFCVFASTEAKKQEASKASPEKPEILQLEPRGIQRGTTTKIKLIGTNLTGLTELALPTPKLTGELLGTPAATTNEAWIEITAAADLSRDAYEIAVRNASQESGKVKLYVDDLPQVPSTELKKAQAGKLPLKLPGTFWGLLERPGDADEITLDARAGDSLVFDLAAKNIGSKTSAALALFEEQGALIASNDGFDGGDPLLHFKIPASGRYRLRIADQTGAGSKDHFYRLSAGVFPYVVSFFPLSVAANRETEVELIGFNLPAKRRIRINAGESGETSVPFDTNKFRSRRPLKALVSDGVELVEREPNDLLRQAMEIPVPSTVCGRIWPAAKARTADADLFRFEAKAGQTWMIETDAARRNSPVDTRIEILHADGRPVERLLLQAVRDSHLTFRPIDSSTDDARVVNWQEMELGQFMYLQGEVCRIFRMPQGPDSGFQFFNVANKRRCYFGTSPTAHALDEPAYIIEPRPPGSKLVANGLPVFTVYYANDDDGERRLGTDSRVQFTTPADGAYLIRVTDTRGHGGERYGYRLLVREARPDFKVTLAGGTPALGPGGGQEFTLTADRIDGFDGDISVEISGVPEGYACSTPTVLQAGHLVAAGTINASSQAKEPKDHQITIAATAEVNGRQTRREVKTFGRITLAERPKLFVALEPYDEAVTNFLERSIGDKPLEITIAPGQIIPAWLKVQRAGHDDVVTFTVNNLPHGVIVDNIGLNGVLIPKGQNERQIFLSAAKWVPETDRLVHAQAKQAGNPTSLPVLLHVRKAGNSVAKVK
jgi:hypothetical protein